MLLRCIVTGILAVTGLSCVTAKPTAKVVFVGKDPDHPFGTHMYMHTGEMLAKCLRLADDVETAVSNGWPQDASVLDGASAIVIYSSPAAEFLLDGPHRDQIDPLIKQGIGLVTIHWASSVRQENLERLGPKWLSYLGGTWVSNVGLHTGKSTLKQLRPEHPICRGWKSYEIHDEYYLNPTISDHAAPLLEVSAQGQAVTVGWAYERPNGGRSFATTLGHYYRNFQDPRFRRMIVNAILWAAQTSVPREGANVAISKDELALPEKPQD